MYYKTRHAALASALRLIDRSVDADALIDAARAAKVELPVEGMHVSSPSTGVRIRTGGLSYRVQPQRHGELIAIVDRLIKSAKAA